METILDFARAIGGMLAVLAIWFGIQAFIRRRSGCSHSVSSGSGAVIA